MNGDKLRLFLNSMVLLERSKIMEITHSPHKQKGLDELLLSLVDEWHLSDSRLGFILLWGAPNGKAASFLWDGVRVICFDTHPRNSGEYTSQATDLHQSQAECGNKLDVIKMIHNLIGNKECVILGFRTTQQDLDSIVLTGTSKEGREIYQAWRSTWENANRHLIFPSSGSEGESRSSRDSHSEYYENRKIQIRQRQDNSPANKDTTLQVKMEKIEEGATSSSYQPIQLSQDGFMANNSQEEALLPTLTEEIVLSPPVSIKVVAYSGTTLRLQRGSRKQVKVGGKVKQGTELKADKC